MIIIVSGLPGSGKSVLVEKLAKRFNLNMVFASDILKQLREKQISQIKPDETKKGTGFWETNEGKQFSKNRLQDTNLDKELDKILLDLIEKEDDLIVDSRTMPWLSNKGFKIWLNASEEVRAERISGRDKKAKDEILLAIRERLENDKKIYSKLYGFELAVDLEPFNLVVDTDELNAEQVFELVEKKIKELLSNS